MVGLIWAIIIVLLIVVPRVASKRKYEQRRQLQSEEYMDGQRYASPKPAEVSRPQHQGAGPLASRANMQGKTMASRANMSTGGAAPLNKEGAVKQRTPSPGGYQGQAPRRSKNTSGGRPAPVQEAVKKGYLAEEGEIVEAAKDNVSELSSDEMLIRQKNLSKELEDLMVKGPNTDIPYERDFLAEAMDMIQTYSQSGL